MKVYIGGYPDTWIRSTIHYNYMNKKYNYDWDKSNTKFEKTLEKCEDIIQWIYDHSINYLVKYRERKVKVRIDPEDTWGMDNTLAHIILPMLKQLKATKHGSPYVDKEDIPKELWLSKREQKVFDHGHYDKKLKATEEEIDEASKKFHAQWVWVMDQMIWSFEQEVNEFDDEKEYYDPYLPDEPIERRTYSVVNEDGTTTEKEWNYESEKVIRDRGKFNYEKYKAYQERKQKGFTLFGKYYQALWD